ncbi:MAG TPA: DNA recombination protein RmuC [Thermoanaerobaculales bacterium]|nr:DNA recombination protein RmuC [Thermoanaerobaculales bacterium]
MTTTLLWILIVLAAGTLVLTFVLLIRGRSAAHGNLEQVLRAELRIARDESSSHARGLREEVSSSQTKANELLVRTVNALGQSQTELLDKLAGATRESAESTRAEIEKLTQRVVESLREIQTENEQRFDKVRISVNEQLTGMLEQQKKQMNDVVEALKKLEDSNRQDQEKSRTVLEQKFLQIQESNEKKLDEMRQTVDEKLHSTLEKRLGESFKLVSDRLEAVQRGLGEMKTLADGVGDLKRVLTNVKDRGTWGEYQLGAILEQTLTPEQYARNVRPKEGGETVEFAIKLPGKGLEDARPVWLPVDAKFPREDYERLLDGVERADTEAVKTATTALANAVRKSAKDIHDKYVAPPDTTDFAIMFLPTEGLYAEILRQPGLHDELQTKYRVLATGPTTLSAMLTSLRVGFQTLAIEERSAEVWNVLAAVKTEFGKFGEVLEKVKRQLSTASDTIDKTRVRTRAMVKKLRSVEQLPPAEAGEILQLAGYDDHEEEREGDAEEVLDPSAV